MAGVLLKGERLERALAVWRTEGSLRELASRFRVSLSTASAIKRGEHAGVNAALRDRERAADGLPPIVDEKLKRALAIWHATGTPEAIAARFGCAKSTVRLIKDGGHSGVVESLAAADRTADRPMPRHYRPFRDGTYPL